MATTNDRAPYAPAEQQVIPSILTLLSVEGCFFCWETFPPASSFKGE